MQVQVYQILHHKTVTHSLNINLY